MKLKKILSILLSIVLLASTLGINLVGTAADSQNAVDTETITALNLKAGIVNGPAGDYQAVLALPIDTAGDYAEFSFDMKVENGITPKFMYRDNQANVSITPVKVEGYRYTFNFQRTTNGDTGSIIRWFFDFTNKTSDVVISNMELYKTDSNYANKQSTNLLAGVYGKNGDFDGWSLSDNYAAAWEDLTAGKILYRGGTNPQPADYNRFTGSGVVTKPIDYFTLKQHALNLKVNGGSYNTHFAMSLPIATGDYVEFSFDMKAESGEIPKFIYRDNYGNKSIEPVKVEGYRYTFNFQRTKTGDTGAVVRWFFDFTNKTSDVVISNMELYKTDSNYANKQSTNLLAGVYGKNGDFDGWSYEDNKVTSWTDLNVAGGKVLCRSGENDLNSNRFDGTAVVTKPLDYFNPKQYGLSLVVNGGPDRTHFAMSLPIATGDYVEFSFDMMVEDGEAPKFLYYDGYNGIKSISPQKVEGYRYTFNFTRTSTGEASSPNVSRWFFDFTGISSTVLISNMELYKTDSTYANKQDTNLLAGVYGKNGDFDGWSLENNRVSTWAAFETDGGGKVLTRSADNLNETSRYPGVAVITRPIDYFSVMENDVNLDKLIDYEDFYNLRKFLLGINKDKLYYLNCDTNGDGSNDIRDLVHLANDEDDRVETYNRYEDFIKYRGQGLENTYAKLKNNQPINVLYMGGSVTEGVGSTDYSSCWRALTAKWFTGNYGALVNNINIAQSGTGTTFGSYRYNEQVAKNNPDLLFIEFSINDKYDEVTVEEAKRGFETIVRQTRIKFPTCDIVAVFVTDQPERDPYTLPRYATAHDEICELYGISSVDVGGALLRHLNNTNGKWSDYVTDTCHPGDSGYIIYAYAVKEYLENCLNHGNYSGKLKEHTIPEMYSNSLLDGDIQYIDVTADMIETSEKNGGSNWKYVETSGYPTQIYGNVLMPTSADCKFVTKFTGTEFALVVFGGATNINVQGYNVTVDGNTSYVERSKYQPHILVTGLELAEHTVIIEPIFPEGVEPYMMISGFFTRNETKMTTKN